MTESMRSLSVITPVLPQKATFIADAERSVRSLRVLASSAGWSIEWLVIVDGPGDIGIADANNVFYLPKQRGISMARNIALTKATSEWVFPLDADDCVNPEGLCSVLEQCQDGVGWIAANRLLMTGEKTPHWRDAAASFGAGMLALQWTSPFPFHPNSAVVRRRVALQAGGWPAVPVNEDLGFMLLVSELADGRFTPDVVTRYRVWDGQEVAAESYSREKTTAFSTLEALVNARRNALAREDVRRPHAGPAYGITVQRN